MLEDNLETSGSPTANQVPVPQQDSSGHSQTKSPVKSVTLTHNELSCVQNSQTDSNVTITVENHKHPTAFAQVHPCPANCDLKEKLMKSNSGDLSTSSTVH